MHTEAAAVVNRKLAELRELTYTDAQGLSAAAFEDIVVAGKEVQLTVFRQQGVLSAADAVLVTVQLARAGLGGIVNFQLERGLVYLPGRPVRDATEDELEQTS